MKNIFFYYGNEDFLIKEELFRVKKDIFGSGHEQQSVEHFSPENTSINDLIPMISSAGLFQEKRLAVVEGYSDEEYETLLGLTQNMPPSVFLIIIARSLDKRSRLYKKLQAAAEIKEFKPFAEWEEGKFVSWIISRVKSLSKTISEEAASALNDISGPSLQQLSSEIDKLATYAGNKKEISGEDVEKLAVSGQLGSFALENALGERDLKGAVSALNFCLKSKERPENLLGKIAGRMRLFMQIKDLEERKYLREAIIKELVMNPYYFDRRYSRSVKRYTMEELSQSFKALSEADIALKNTQQSPQVLMELLLVDIISHKA